MSNVIGSAEIQINRVYKDYEPPFDVERLVRKLFSTVPEKYLLELRGFDETVGVIQERPRREDLVPWLEIFENRNSRPLSPSISVCALMRLYKLFGRNGWI
jgi:hypothetical protein